MLVSSDGGGIEVFPDLVDQVATSFHQAWYTSYSLNSTLSQAKTHVDNAFAKHRDRLGSVDSELARLGTVLAQFEQQLQDAATGLHVVAENWRKVDAAMGAQFDPLPPGVTRVIP